MWPFRKKMSSSGTAPTEQPQVAEPGMKLARDDIIGHRIKAIFGRFELDDGIQVSSVVIVLDSGIAFRIPSFPDEIPKTVCIPEGAGRFEEESWDKVIGAVVTHLLRPSEDEDFNPDSPALLGLSTGKWLFHWGACPDGLGAGLYVLVLPGRENLVDFWTRVPYRPRSQ